MPIRSIKDYKYKGVSELYRESDGLVTGYYVTYRDVSGKPVKKRVEAKNRDEALLKLIEIKNNIESEKQNSSNITTSVKNKEEEKELLPEEHKSAFWGNSMIEYQKRLTLNEDISFVSLLDIVAFDDINILYGYEAGDKVMEEIKQIIVDTFESFSLKSTLLYDINHLYADRLCICIKDDLDNRIFEIIVKELLNRISLHRFNVVPNTPIHVNATLGATKGNYEKSLIYAEKALREAKQTQLGYIFYDNFSTDKEDIHDNKIYEMLLNNIDQQSVTPVFQGIFDANDSDVPCKFESLMRLQDSNGHMLSPAVFLGKSKEYRLYKQLMLQMIDKVFDVLENNTEASFTINLSYLDFNNEEICEKLISEVKRLNVGDRLTVEILETEQIKDMNIVNDCIFKLKKHGVLIAIDDFGSGFSNFDNILNLDVDFIKIDGSLISNIHNKKHRVILENIVRICKELEIKTIAEYISDAKIMQVAKSIGVDYFQGYFFHKPQQWANVANAFGFKGIESA